jgi:Protein of unknown function (DUF2569)
MDKRPNVANQQPTSPPWTSAPAEPRYRGILSKFHYRPSEIPTRVGGWLLLFCLTLTVFSPLITLSSLAAGYGQVSKYFDEFPGLRVITVIDTLLSLGLMAFSIYAGTRLWSIRPRAVQIAKRYLLCLLGYYAVGTTLPFLSGLPSAANWAMMAALVKDTLRGVFYLAVWYSYLHMSERVKATYAL